MAKGETSTGRELLRDVAIVAVVGALALAGLDLLSD